MAFTGFSEETLRFFVDLEMNNNKRWFDDNRARYDEHVLAPTRAFIEAAGERIREFAPDIIAEPKVNRSMFRINRDTRFSTDKTPYKTNVAVIMWEGRRKRMESAGFYFHLEPDAVMIGGGIYAFAPYMLGPWREAVADAKRGAALEKAIATVEAAGLSIRGDSYKRVPKGYDAEHPRGELLKKKGLHYGVERQEPTEVLFTPEFVDVAVERFRTGAELHRWLVDFTESID